ncbi:MAG: hypothetical protein HY961_15980 [Ignavibacteriae bacterium]|nr:hypothetical protein [Ignavibacteriota bacterium]
MILEKYSIGVGDRFVREGAAQLRALQMVEKAGATVVPVWNKSNREHVIIGTVPDSVRTEADAAVKTCGWKHSYYVDADHIGLATVDRFVASSNFFTIDVADFIGKPTSPENIDAFVSSMMGYIGKLSIPGIDRQLDVSKEFLRSVGEKYLYAIEQAGAVYRHIAAAKGVGNFVPEVSADETNAPQTPAELFFILAAVAREGIPIQTIAPKFTGSFLKGVDYVGSVNQFKQEFEDDLAVIKFAIERFSLPKNLKLSVHSGSDKFSLYPIIHRALKKFDAGIHLKTAGTTWLEEVIGLAAAGGEALQVAKEVYAASYDRYDELCKPYLTVIDIDRAALPTPKAVSGWTSEEFLQAIRHDQSCKNFDRNLRQLIHVGYKVAAEMGNRFTDLLDRHSEIIGQNVTDNIYRRHLVPLFLGSVD